MHDKGLVTRERAGRPNLYAAVARRGRAHAAGMRALTGKGQRPGRGAAPFVSELDARRRAVGWSSSCTDTRRIDVCGSSYVPLLVTRRSGGGTGPSRGLPPGRHVVMNSKHGGAAGTWATDTGTAGSNPVAPIPVGLEGPWAWGGGEVQEGGWCGVGWYGRGFGLAGVLEENDPVHR